MNEAGSRAVRSTRGFCGGAEKRVIVRETEYLFHPRRLYVLCILSNASRGCRAPYSQRIADSFMPTASTIQPARLANNVINSRRYSTLNLGLLACLPSYLRIALIKRCIKCHEYYFASNYWEKHEST